jgi:excisionase family DNA binding protein
MVTAALEIRPNIYYTPEEVASILRVPYQNVQELLETGLARGIKIGENWRVLGRDLLRLPSADELADAELTRSLMLLSQPAFAKVWDNDEDSVYDDL